MLLILLTSALLAAPPAPPAKGKPKKSEPAKSEPAKSEPAKPEPAKPEPAKPEPVKPEPAKPEPVKPEPAAPAPAPAPAATTTSTAAPAAAVPTATESAKKPPLKLGAPGLNQVGLTKELIAFYNDHLAQQLVLAGVVVSTPSEIQAVIGLERQRQLIGCEGAECVGDLGALLGVEGLITGAIAKVGSNYQLNIKVIDGKTGAGLTAASVTVGSESELLESMGRVARAMARELFVKLDRSPTGISAQQDVNAGWVRRRSWIPALAGVALMGAGVPLLISGNNDFVALRDELTPADFDAGGRLAGQTPASFKQSGQLKQTLGFTLTAVGGAALLTAGAMFLFGGEKDQPVVVMAPLSTGGAAVVISGALP